MSATKFSRGQSHVTFSLTPTSRTFYGARSRQQSPRLSRNSALPSFHHFSLFPMNRLPFRELIQGQDYWIQDQALPNALEIAQRCIAKTTWTLGSPWRPEPWPGMRAPEALTPEEVLTVETYVTTHLGIPHLTPQTDSEAGFSGHNHIQLCGGAEGVARPHVDSARICDYAPFSTSIQVPPRVIVVPPFTGYISLENRRTATIVQKILRVSAKCLAYHEKWIPPCSRKSWKLPMSLTAW